MDASSLFHKHRLELHRPNPVYLAVYIVVGVYEATYAHFCADFRGFGGAFDFQVFDKGHPIALLEGIAIGVFIDSLCCLF